MKSFNDILKKDGVSLKSTQCDEKFRKNITEGWKSRVEEIWLDRKLSNHFERLNKFKSCIDPKHGNENVWLVR